MYIPVKVMICIGNSMITTGDKDHIKTLLNIPDPTTNTLKSTRLFNNIAT